MYAKPRKQFLSNETSLGAFKKKKYFSVLLSRTYNHHSCQIWRFIIILTILCSKKSMLKIYFSVLLNRTYKHSCQIWRLCAPKRVCWRLTFQFYSTELTSIAARFEDSLSFWRFCAPKRVCWRFIFQFYSTELTSIAARFDDLSSIWRFCVQKKVCWRFSSLIWRFLEIKHVPISSSLF